MDQNSKPAILPTVLSELQQDLLKDNFVEFLSKINEIQQQNSEQFSDEHKKQLLYCLEQQLQNRLSQIQEPQLLIGVIKVLMISDYMYSKDIKLLSTILQGKVSHLKYMLIFYQQQLIKFYEGNIIIKLKYLSIIDIFFPLLHQKVGQQIKVLLKKFNSIITQPNNIQQQDISQIDSKKLQMGMNQYINKILKRWSHAFLNLPIPTIIDQSIKSIIIQCIKQIAMRNQEQQFIVQSVKKYTLLPEDKLPSIIVCCMLKYYENVYESTQLSLICQLSLIRSLQVDQNNRITAYTSASINSLIAYIYHKQNESDIYQFLYIDRELSQTWIQLTKCYTQYLGHLQPQSQTYKQLIHLLNLPGLKRELQQFVWRQMIQKHCTSQSYTIYCMMQYKKLFQSNNSLYQIYQIGLFILKQFQTIKPNQNIDLIAHLLSMFYYWFKCYQNPKYYNKQHPWLMQQFHKIANKLSQISKQMKNNLNIRQQVCKDKNQQREISLCIFRIDQLKLNQNIV